MALAVVLELVLQVGHSHQSASDALGEVSWACCFVERFVDSPFQAKPFSRRPAQCLAVVAAVLVALPEAEARTAAVGKIVVALVGSLEFVLTGLLVQVQTKC